MKVMPLFDRFGFALAGCSIGLVVTQLTAAPIGPFATAAAVLGLGMIAGGGWAGLNRAKRVTSKAEQALRIIESMPALAWFADMNGKFLKYLYVNTRT